MRSARLQIPASALLGALALAAALPAWARGGAEKAAPPGLVVYTYDAFGETLQEAIVRHFEGLGVAVSFSRFEDTGGLYGRLYLERDRPVADVAIGLDTTYLARAHRDGLFQPYEPAELRVADPTLIVDPSYRLVPFDYGGVLLNVDRKALPRPPTTWEELLDPSLERKIILMSPATSSPGRNFLLLTIEVFGEDKYLDFWRALKPNVLTVTPGWSEGYGLYTQGEAPIVLSYDTSPVYHLQFENESRYESLILGDSAYAQVEVAGILAGARNLENARRLMDYLVSPELQALIPLSQVMYPVHPEVPLPEAFRTVPRAGHLVSLDEDRVAANFERWLREWENVMR
jgi:thiamine transport system substrate-binding protein